MSVENTTTKVVYAGNGVTNEWPVPFQYARSEDIALLIDDGTTQTDITSNYKIVVNESGDTSVTYPVSGTAVAAGNKLAIYRSTPRTQVVDLVYGGAFAPDVLENDGLDRIVMMTQELSRDVDRAVKLPITSSDSPETVVAAIYASRDAAAASANNASAQATAAQNSADMAAHSAETAAQTVQTATAEAVTAATTQANAAQNAANAAAQSALDAAAAVPGNLVGRVTNVEGIAAASKTITDKATATPTAGGMPIAGAEKHLSLGWFGSMLCNVRTVITVSGDFVMPISGWLLGKAIGAGGAGGGAPIHGGGGGGTTSFGAYLSAIGGAGGAGNGRSSDYQAHGGSGGGGAGEVAEALIYLTKGTVVPVTIGAGGVCSTVYNTMPTGAGAPTPSYGSGYDSAKGAPGAKGAGNGTPTSYDATNGSHASGSGGNGARNGTGYGGGGGGAGAAIGTGGLGADGATNGSKGSSTSTVSVQGGTGGNGAVIIEYFDPAIVA